MGKSLKRVLLLAVLLAVFVQGQTPVTHAYSLGSPQLLENLGSNDNLPTAFPASNGTLWVAWEAFSGNRPDIFVMTYNGVVWSPIQNLTGPSTLNNIAPSLNQFQNGTIILVWSSNLGGSYNLRYKLFNNGVWAKPVQFTTTPYDDVLPHTVVAADGTLWVFWERQYLSTVCFSGACRQVWYKTLKGNTWSPDAQLTFDLTWNRMPNPMRAKDGSIWLAYSKWIGSATSGNFDVFYRTFNGTQWSSDIQLTNLTNSDQAPDLVQDRNGTIWLFWAREFQLAPGVFQNKLMYKFSGDAGRSWTSEIQFTFGGNSTNTIDDNQPFAVQGRDQSLWIFYSSDATGAGSLFDIYYIKTNRIWPIHDLAVSSVQVSSGCVSPVFPSCLYPYGDACSCVATVSVTVSDLGDFIENASLTVRAVNRTSFIVSSAWSFMAGGTSKVFTFTWNSSAVGALPGRYTIIASVQPVPGETIGASLDDLLSYKTLNVLLPGDLTKDGTVNIIDAGIMGAAYNSRPGYPNWNPDADIARFGVVNIIDFGILGANYGKSI